ncbi:BRO-N domain-containing protein [Streptococcus pneumoniae]|uniref:BRO-N domain-containing protein n=1 Tax=Streptococcus pneumoniae TaxID=1313 RepID=UPI0005DDD9D5|nr:BRO family protein [Streptococcus pneumoniae]CJE20852.1 antirepressor [Streptococcus pneumoniae]COQ56303.1 antirepressor [Streptococcus pneumoniae]
MELQIFKNEQFGEVRTASIDGQIYFNLKDCCQVLEIKNHNDALQRLNLKGVVTTDLLTNGGVQQANFINEANFYKLAFQSRKPEAEKFADWVTSEVLPSIRKHGAYIANQIAYNTALQWRDHRGGRTQKELRNALKSYKARNNLTWANMATLLDIPQESAKRYSTGRYRITERIANRLALLLEDEAKPIKTGEIERLTDTQVLETTLVLYGTNDRPLFLAKDIAKIVGHRTDNIHQFLKNVDDSEKVRNNITTLGGKQEAWFLTEEGLYEVLMQSRKPIAKQFKTQVKAILKDIRQKGYYAKARIIKEQAEQLEGQHINIDTLLEATRTPISDLDYINEHLYRAIEKDTLEGKISALENVLKLAQVIGGMDR